MEAHPGIQATGLHATVDLDVRDEAIALASIPHPSLAIYANVLDERERQQERIMADQEAEAQHLEEDAKRATGTAMVKPEPIETIILDDTPSPAPARTATPSTPSVLPNWLKRKAVPIKAEAKDTETVSEKTGKRTKLATIDAATAEGVAIVPAATTTGTTVEATTGLEAKQEADPTTLTGLGGAVTPDNRPVLDMEVEEVEPPATEPGTWVFPQVRRGEADCRAELTYSTGTLHRMLEEG